MLESFRTMTKSSLFHFQKGYLLCFDDVQIDLHNDCVLANLDYDSQGSSLTLFWKHAADANSPTTIIVTYTGIELLKIQYPTALHSQDDVLEYVGYLPNEPLEVPVSYFEDEIENCHTVYSFSSGLAIQVRAQSERLAVVVA